AAPARTNDETNSPLVNVRSISPPRGRPLQDRSQSPPASSRAPTRAVLAPGASEVRSVSGHTRAVLSIEFHFFTRTRDGHPGWPQEADRKPPARGPLRATSDFRVAPPGRLRPQAPQELM